MAAAQSPDAVPHDVAGNGRSRWYWLIPLILTVAGGLVGYGSLRSDVANTRSEAATTKTDLQRQIDQKVDLQVVTVMQQQILDAIHEVDARLGRLESRRP